MESLQKMAFDSLPLMGFYTNDDQKPFVIKVPEPDEIVGEPEFIFLREFKDPKFLFQKDNFLPLLPHAGNVEELKNLLENRLKFGVLIKLKVVAEDFPPISIFVYDRKERMHARMCRR